MNFLVRAMLLLDIMMLNRIFTKSLDYNTGQNIVDRKNKSIFFVSHPVKSNCCPFRNGKKDRQFLRSWCHIRDLVLSFATNKYVIQQMLSYLF